MQKLPVNRHFIKAFEDLLTGNLRSREVVIYGIVAQFEANQTPCFISRAELAKRINESEATAERSVQLLIAEGYLVARRVGRKRYLSTSYPQKPNLYQPDTGCDHDLYQNQGQSVSKQGGDLYQPDTLTRSITRSINKTKLTRLKNTCKKQLSDRDRFFNDHGYYPDDLPD